MIKDVEGAEGILDDTFCLTLKQASANIVGVKTRNYFNTFLLSEVWGIFSHESALKYVIFSFIFFHVVLSM